MKRIVLTTLALMLLGLLAPATAQNILSFDVPTEMCPDERDTVTFGVNPGNDIRVNEVHTALGHSDTVFLPDGVPCNGSCSYVSPVTFSGFDPTTKIRNVNDIKYVRLKMEHSYIADIFIRITCPSNKKATLMRFGGYNTSECYGTIPTDQRGWLTGNNVSGGSNFGIPVDAEDSYYPCNPSRSSNRPGVGWNYCWSNNSNSGYQYASGDGIIYRSGHVHNDRVDSSNVRQKTNFYHPDQSFSNLVGCPVNGTWTVEVVDGYGQDNGYIFEWEIVINPQLTPIADCVPESYNVTGPNVEQLNDSVFVITSPSDIVSDSVINYTYSVVTTCGQNTDSVVPLTVYPKYNIIIDSLVCDGVADTIVENLSSIHGCDSTVTLRIGVLHSSDTTIHQEAVENDLPVTMQDIDFYAPIDTSFLFKNMVQCDSTVHYLLDVYYNHEPDTLREQICENTLPYLWDGLSFDDADTVTLDYQDIHGADSTTVYILTLKPTSDTTILDTICENMVPYHIAGHTYLDSGRYDIPLTAANGCDSTVHLSLGFYPPIDEYLFDTTCDNVPYHIAGNTYTDSGQYDIKFIAHNGCDSMLHLNLSLLPHYEAHHYDTLCYGNGLEFYGVVYTNTGTYVHPLQTVQGCDSLILLHLSAMSKDLKAAMQINPRIVTLDNLEFNLYNTSHYSSYGIWSIDDRTYTERNLSMHYPTEYDSLPVTLVAYSPEGCTDTARATVTIDRSLITTPNVFTPNQEINNVWCVAKHEILTTELWIYTRAGNLVKHIGVGEEPCWDGTFEGEACPQGTYVYTLLYTTESRPDRVQKQLGTILLLR